MSIFIVIVCILLLVFLITYLKVNSFVAFLLISLSAGVMLGIPLPDLAKTIQKGLGDTLGSLVTIIVLGAMLGKLVAESGAAQQISGTLINIFGQKNMAWGLMFSHVNDGGFWLFKEYFNLSISETIRSWSVMESIVSVVGLIGVLALNAII